MKQLIHISFGIICVIVLPQCANIQTKKTFEPIQAESQKRIGVSPEWTAEQHMPLLPATMTMQEAIALGLQHNASLQALFEDVGIRKADLLQAGFYTNPHIESIFKIPHNNTTIQTKIEVSATFMLSDLWQVPLRKKVAQQSLELKTHEIMSAILQLKKNIQHAYLECVYQEKSLTLVQEIAAITQEIQKYIDYRYQFGFNNDLDKYNALSRHAEWQAKTIDANTQLDTAYICLYHLLGMPISKHKLSLASPLEITPLTLSQQEIEAIALASHPYILIEQAKIAKAQAEVNYEQLHVIDNVTVGIAYERDFTKNTSGVGPSFGIDIPFGNTNYGNIERAHFAKIQAQKNVLAQQRLISADIAQHYALYASYLKQLEQYQRSVLPPLIQATQWSKKFLDTMQIDKTIVFESQINLALTQLKLLELTYTSAKHHVDLELSAGMALNNIDFIDS